MPRIIGVSIPDKKRIVIALTYIYGIGLSLSKKIIIEAGINPLTQAGNLKPEEINLLREIIEKKYKVEGGLGREIMTAVKRLKEIGSWRGLRHIKRLPVRGQRTKTNTRTVRGNVRKTVGSGRKAPPSAK